MKKFVVAVGGMTAVALEARIVGVNARNLSTFDEHLDLVAREVATQLMAHDALGAHARDELGMTESQSARPYESPDNRES